METNALRLLAGFATLAFGLHAQQYRIDTFAGGANSADGGPAISGLLLQAQGIAFDTEHHLYIADPGDHRVRRVENDGSITTFAGTGVAGFSGDGGPAKDAQLRTPYGLAVDSSDNVFIADLGNSRIRKVSADGTITTIAGGGLAVPGSDSDGGLATDYVLGSPRDVAVAPDGSVFVSDFSRDQVYKVASDFTLTTIAGTGQAGQGSEFGAAFLTVLNSPAGLAVLNNGSVLVCDSGNHVVRRIVGSRIQPFVVHGTSGLPIQFSVPTGLAVKPDGSVLIADQAAGVVYQVDKSGQAVALPAAASGIAADNRGNVFVSAHGSVHQLKPDGSLVGIAGNANGHFLGEGVDATAARLDQPSAVVMDASGNAYIADTGNNRIRKVDAHGTITTFAGNGSAGYSGDGAAAIAAQLNHPSALALDANGNLVVADTGNNAIRSISVDGSISTVAGTGNAGVATDGQPAVGASLNAPSGLVVSGATLYISDTGNHSVRAVDAQGNIRRVAGMDAAGSDGDNGPALSAHMEAPLGLAIDAQGNLFVADGGAGSVRRVGSDGTITTVTNASHGPWLAPAALSIAGDGSLLVLDAGTHELRAVQRDGTSLLLAGTGSMGFSGDQGPAVAAQLNSPSGLFVSSNGSIYIADTGNSRVRVLTTDGSSIPPNVPPVKVVNAASRIAGPVAPGELVSILGPQLGTGDPQYSGNSSTLPTALADTQVLINGRPAPILFVRSGEIELQIPYELAGSNAAQLEVLWQGTPVGAAALTVAAAAPGIYSLDGTGGNTALVLQQNGMLNGQTNPAGPGWLMTVFVTGEGLTSGTNKTGTAPETGSSPLLPMTVFLNGQQLQTIAVEELSGMPGVAAVTCVLPNQLTSGAASLRIAEGGSITQPNLTVWTQGNP